MIILFKRFKKYKQFKWNKIEIYKLLVKYNVINQIIKFQLNFVRRKRRQIVD